MAIRQITIIGTGLVGGSFGLALKKRRFQGRIVGCDREAVFAAREQVLAEAVARTATVVTSHNLLPGWSRVSRTEAAYEVRELSR